VRNPSHCPPAYRPRIRVPAFSERDHRLAARLRLDDQDNGVFPGGEHGSTRTLQLIAEHPEVLLTPHLSIRPRRRRTHAHLGTVPNQHEFWIRRAQNALTIRSMRF
jgi:hypothetical protein